MQNSISFGTGSGEIGLKPDFSIKFKVAFPKLKLWKSLILVKLCKTAKQAARRGP
jgi:hypothetical protein